MYTEWVATREIRPLFSSSILPSGSGTDHTLDLMDYLLNCLTTQVRVCGQYGCGHDGEGGGIGCGHDK